jgi:hypothetical protein
MTVSPSKSFSIKPFILASAVFSALTLPLAIFGSEPVAIEVQKQPIFHGRLRDIAAPYLGFAATLSLGAAVSAIAASGWRKSARTSAQVEAELSVLQKNLQEAETRLQALKLSSDRLKASGLDVFLEDALTATVALTSAVAEDNTLTTATSTPSLPIPITTVPVQSGWSVPSTIATKKPVSVVLSLQCAMPSWRSQQSI